MMKIKYNTPNVEIESLNAVDVIAASATGQIDTTDYGFRTEATYVNQGQEWVSEWDA